MWLCSQGNGIPKKNCNFGRNKGVVAPRIPPLQKLLTLDVVESRAGLTIITC